MTIRLSVCLFKNYHCCFWELRARNYIIAKLADMIRDVVQEMHIQKVEIQIVDKMSCNFRLDMHFVVINAMIVCSRRMIVLSGVTLPFLLFDQCKMHFEPF
jgi:hypothetical protein